MGWQKLSTGMAKTVNWDGFREIITKLIRLVKWLPILKTQLEPSIDES